jgi:hypothetical protein
LSVTSLLRFFISIFFKRKGLRDNSSKKKTRLYLLEHMDFVSSDNSSGGRFHGREPSLWVLNAAFGWCTRVFVFSTPN